MVQGILTGEEAIILKRSCQNGREGLHIISQHGTLTDGIGNRSRLLINPESSRIGSFDQSGAFGRFALRGRRVLGKPLESITRLLPPANEIESLAMATDGSLGIALLLPVGDGD